MIDTIYDGPTLLGYLISGETLPEKTTFVTPPHQNFQLGYIVYPEGSEIPRHIHTPVERRVRGTSEVLVVKRGRCEVTFYGEQKNEVAKREMRTGDILLFVTGGHGFRVLEDTVLLEVKQGPYGGEADKERF